MTYSPSFLPDASYFLQQGIALGSQGRFAEAADALRRAAGCQPDCFDAHFYLGVALERQGYLEEAATSYERALQIQPDRLDALNNWGNIGILWYQRRDLPRALMCYQKVLSYKADFAEIHTNLGLVFADQGRWEDAAESHRRALHLKPDYAEAYHNLGCALQNMERLDEAVSAYYQAINLRPDHVLSYNNLANIYAAQGRLGEAESAYRQALALDPDYADGHYNLSLLLLLQGLFEPGWAEYEWRWRRSGMQPRVFSQPRWNGAALPAGTILLLAEQGLGDTLHFLRYARLVRQRVGRVVLECQPALLSLARSCPGLTQVLAQGEPLPAFDVQAPLLSLPGLFHTNLASIPAEVPYLTADPARVAYWRQHLAHESRFKVGLVWQGSRQYGADRHRSAPLKTLTPLTQVPGVALYSIQVGEGSEQLASARLPITDLGSQAVPLDNLAALLVNLDLLVSVDTAPAHLAGALGVPVWLALSKNADWRWLLDRTDSPWYPTARLFRQEQAGDWDSVFLRIAADMRNRARD